MFNKEILDLIHHDNLKFGSALIFSQIFIKSDLNNINIASILEPKFLKILFLTLLGFAIFQSITRQILKIEKIESDKIRYTIFDILRLFTMILVSRNLAGNNVFHQNWIKEGINIITGFAIYGLFLRAPLEELIINENLNYKYQNMLKDLIKYPTTLSIIGTLSHNTSIQNFDANYIKFIIGYTSGFLFYDYFFSKKLYKV